MKEWYYDKLLNIKTADEQKGFNKSQHYFRYEPTPYIALEELFKHYSLKSSDRVVDFGCGKGRLNFYIHYLFNATVTGIEMNELFYAEALENRKKYLQKTKNSKENLHFKLCYAEEYRINPLDNKFYFFNPFSVEIFINIVNNILISVEESAREIELVLYYASDEYVFFLENRTAFELKEEIILPILHKRDPYEKFLIYCLSY